MLTVAQLQTIAPNVGNAATVYTNTLNNAMQRFGIDTPLRMAHFLAQLVHESDGLTAFRENLNYSANRLLAIWPKRFANIIEAQHYERQPMKLANYVYANRMGNGDATSGDGWKYRGAGWFQLTGKTNHEQMAKELGVINSDIGEWLSTVNGAALSAAWFWWKNGCNRLADMNNCEAVSDIINLGRRTAKEGDSIGFARRKELTDRIIKILVP